MKKFEAKERIEKLKKEIHHHRYLYHVLDAPVLSDEAVDALKKELSDLEKTYPEYLASDSPSQRVGGFAREEFTKVAHVVPQWSLNDAFEENEVYEFHERTIRFLKKHGIKAPKPTYTVELKIDGLHVVLTYKNGVFVTGATRGDGKIGEDVTNNLKTIESIPLRLEKNIDVIVGGEVWLSKKQFEKINKGRLKAGEPEYANPRNTAAGTIRQLDPKIVRARKLDCFMYDLASSKNIPETQEKELKILLSLGFKVNKLYKHFSSVDGVIRFWKQWEKKKDTLPYMIDGVVIKVNERDYQEILGYTGKSPRYSLAIKFLAEQTTTIVEDIIVQIGRTGALTPVAALKPVKIAGSTVKRATLHNEDEILRLGLKIGDTVVIQKAGDIIPEVVEVIKNLRPKNARLFNMPKKCPICKSDTKKKVGEVALYCSNRKCFAQELAQIIHFVSKGAFNIEGLGDKVVLQLMEAGLVSSEGDIFSLKVEDLSPLERLGQKSAENIVGAIQQSKKIDESKFIFSLGIRFVGSETAYLLAQAYPVSGPKEFLKILEINGVSDIENIDGVGIKTAESIHAWVKNSSHKSLLEQLHFYGISFTHTKAKHNTKISGKTFVLTGTLQNYSREYVKQLLKSRGAVVSSTVSTKTDFVVAGESPGSKYKKAKTLGVTILSENAFKSLIKE